MIEKLTYWYHKKNDSKTNENIISEPILLMVDCFVSEAKVMII